MTNFANTTDFKGVSNGFISNLFWLSNVQFIDLLQIK